ncbi:ParA family protein [Candidatus Nitrosocosmicus hydrocola]|jgi:MinD-like ATPase involved in chromosome partitioning or flagellar assembly|uniref:ParA family protein n=1 Tax=Candidatus Nitrosocosmicus hydrocola TaxID=1826872 RepID=UPI0011E5A0AB|nr:MinD/ParA family protein [Candidatus Nitrosocosmicus hydrocola]
MTHCIAIHSYKGGTGKTTIAANAAALLVQMGKKVAILDLDVYAPSLHNYFKINPKKWINDFLDNNADIYESIIDMTHLLFPTGQEQSNSKGKLYVGFSNPSRDAIFKFEMGNGTDYWKKQFRKLVFLREQIITKLDTDYIIIDTSPGIRHWSINALSIADKLILTMKMDDLDIEGTKKLLFEIYTTFVRFGAISYILLNRVSGYCIPCDMIESNLGGNQDHKKVLEELHDATGANSLSPLPCYCDIQFSPREFLTVLNNPNHPFSLRLKNIINEMTNKA